MERCPQGAELRTEINHLNTAATEALAANNHRVATAASSAASDKERALRACGSCDMGGYKYPDESMSQPLWLAPSF